MLRSILAALVTLICLGSALPMASALEIDAADFGVSKNRKLKLVSMSGPIDSDSVFEVVEFFETYFYKDKSRNLKNTSALPMVIIFKSEGGRDLENFQDMAKAILEASDDHYLFFRKPMVFVFEGECASGCTLLAAHLTKMKDENNFTIITENRTPFIFHAPSPYSNGRAGKFKSQRARDTEITKLVTTYYQAGVSATFLDANRSMFQNDHGTVMTAESLCKANVGLLPSNACLADTKTIFKVAVSILTSQMKEPHTILADAAKKEQFTVDFELPEIEFLHDLSSTIARLIGVKI